MCQLFQTNLGIQATPLTTPHYDIILINMNHHQNVNKNGNEISFAISGGFRDSYRKALQTGISRSSWQLVFQY